MNSLSQMYILTMKLPLESGYGLFSDPDRICLGGGLCSMSALVCYLLYIVIQLVGVSVIFVILMMQVVSCSSITLRYVYAFCADVDRTRCDQA